MGILWLIDRRPDLNAFRTTPTVGENGDTVLDANPQTTADEFFIRPLGPVLSAAAAASPYSLVRIVSHGEPGHLFFSHDGVTAENAHQFGALHGHIQVRQNRVGIEIHGCGVASSWLPPPRQISVQGIGITAYRTAYDEGQVNTGWGAIPDECAMLDLPGIRLLARLARATGVGVKGAVNYQVPDAAWAYEGPTISILHGNFGLHLVLEDPANQLHRGNYMDVPIGPEIH